MDALDTLGNYVITYINALTLFIDGFGIYIGVFFIIVGIIVFILGRRRRVRETTTEGVLCIVFGILCLIMVAQGMGVFANISP